MKELDAIIAEVKDALAAKGLEIDNVSGTAITYVKDAFKNRQMEVAFFEQSISLLTVNAAQKSNIIANCKMDAQELLGEISKILV